jgi:hypothetical protein
MRWGVAACCLAPVLACSGETVSENPDAAPKVAVPPVGSGGSAAAPPSGRQNDPSSAPPGVGVPAVAGTTAPDDGGAPSPPVDAGTPLTAGALWTSDDGPILGLAYDANRIFCVTQSKLTSIARDGSGATVLAQSSDRFAYSGAIATSGGVVYWGLDSPTAGVSAIPASGGTAVSLGSEGYATRRHRARRVTRVLDDE